MVPTFAQFFRLCNLCMFIQNGCCTRGSPVGTDADMAGVQPNVRSIRHATFATPDVARMVAYYREIMGLEALSVGPNAASLACPGHGVPSVILRQGDGARCLSIALEVAEPDAAAAAARASGLPTEERSDPDPGVGRVIAIQAPHNVEVELVAASQSSAAAAVGGRPIAPRKLGHVAFNVGDVKRAVQFYVDGLGFRVADWMGDFFAFLRCGPDHHTVNILPGEVEKMHHIAFEAADWEAIRRACDHLGPRGYPLIWGPGRHGIGHNIFIYHWNPDGQIVELYTELDQMSDEAAGFFDPRPWHEDNPQRPKVWTPGIGASNQWGIPTPESFRK